MDHRRGVRRRSQVADGSQAESIILATAAAVPDLLPTGHDASESTGSRSRGAPQNRSFHLAATPSLAAAGGSDMPPTGHDTSESTGSRSRGAPQQSSTYLGATVPPTLVPSETATCSPRPSRIEPVACRSANRLSLTLPIAPPTSGPSRPTPASTATSSMPPTPIETPSIPRLSDTSDFIIAIAAQECRVLELREELVRAEANLRSLKAQWTAREPRHQIGTGHHVNVPNHVVSVAQDDISLARRRSVELDRRRHLLQNNNLATPTQGHRRTVLRGRHARTLSLLSPAKPSSNLSMRYIADTRPTDRKAGQPGTPSLPARTSWPPRSAQSSPTVPALVEDFKVGIRAFVDEIRQITVGDEPIRGQLPYRSPSVQQQGRAASKRVNGEAGGSKTGSSPQPNSLLSGSATPLSSSRVSKDVIPSLERPKPTKSKPFAWQPLGLESMDDGDLACWDSPIPPKSTRWSDSTINSTGLEDFGSIPEAGEDGATPVKIKASKEESLAFPPKLEEMLPNVVNRLSPSHLKRTANNFMEEWKKSLISPELGNKENGVTKM